MKKIICLALILITTTFIGCKKDEHTNLADGLYAEIETSKGITKFEVEFKQGVKTIELFYTIDGTEIKE